MVSSLDPFVPTCRDGTVALRARYLGAENARPVGKHVLTQVNASGRSPRMDLVLSNHRLQPYIHDGQVTVVYKKKEYKFQVFVKNHKNLPANRIGNRWRLGAPWKGDILVMKKNGDGDVINLPCYHDKLADLAARRFVQRIRQRQRFHVPRDLHVKFRS